MISAGAMVGFSAWLCYITVCALALALTSHAAPSAAVVIAFMTSPPQSESRAYRKFTTHEIAAA
jgi:hypothetical protein